ncbi:hypothetical protein IDH29_03895 [Pelagibacterales bacterium SAG-MED06]|nr:hypothetical protein [Pelagibacterales bacterium SAG-MED06]
MKKILNIFFLSFNASLILMVLTPQISFFYQYNSDLDFFSHEVLYDGLILLIPVTIFFSIIFIFGNLVFKKDLALNILIFLIIYLFLCSINPVLNSGVSDMRGLTHDIALHKFFINIILSFTIYYYFLRDNNFNFYSFILTFMILIFTTIIFYLNTQKIINTKLDKISLGQKNIVVFSFDGIPGHIVNKIFEKNSSFKEVFKDFTLYKSTISHSPATYASVFSEIYGSQNWKQIADKKKDLHRLSKEWSELEQFNYFDGSYLFGTYSAFDYKNISKFKGGSHQYLGKEKEFFYFSTIGFISSSLCKTGFCILGKKYGNFSKYLQNITELINLDISRFDIKHSYLSFQKILKKIEKDKKNFGSFFGHFIFSHFPVHHDENCEFRIYSFPNSEKTLINQAHCIIQSMKETIDVLKKNDIYHQSLIVFKSDHGKPINFYDKNILRGQPLFRNDNMWGYDRYRPFLMIKKPNHEGASLQTDNEIFYLSNLSNLYCKYGLPEENVQNDTCDELSKNLLMKYGMNGKEKKYLFLPQKTNDFRFKGHSAFAIPNNISQLRKMFEEFTVE